MPKKNKELSTLDIAMNAVAKKHGAVLHWLNEVPSKHDFISTGSIALDHALGGGFVKGRMVEVYGWEGCGKTTLALCTIAQANKLGLRALYLDLERAMNPALPPAYGVNPELFLLENAPVAAEEHLEIMESLIGSGNIQICVLDSTTALTPKAELEGEMGDSHVGLQARLMSQATRKLIQLLGDTGCLFIFISQFREKVLRGPGDPKTTSGGNAIKFYATHRLELRGSGKYKSNALLGPDGEVIGHKMHYNVDKNKISTPFRSGEIDLIYGHGFDQLSELTTLATSLGVVNMSGAWYNYEGMKFQGAANFKEALCEDTMLAGKVRETVLNILWPNERPLAYVIGEENSESAL